MNSFLSLEKIVVQFGGLTAVNDFSLRLKPGELVGLIGPNGAGKTTVFNIITGFLRPTSGRVRWLDHDITGLAAHRITALGIARTFQNIRLFANMSVLENVMVSFHHNVRSHFWQAMLGTPGSAREERRQRTGAMQVLEEMSLTRFAAEKAGALPYGQQRRLEIARALAASPRLLLLDEPAAGMNPLETMELARLIRHLMKKYKLTVLLIEHDMKFVMRLCERIKVLDYGHGIAEGTPREIQDNPAVVKAYLGSVKHA